MLRIGVIGAGRIAQIAHLATLSTVADAQIVALADLRLDLAALVAARWNIPNIYPSHSELLADKRVDAVVVVTQRTQTAGIVGEVLRAGKHVLSEKPMALSSADARDLVALASAQHACYAIGYMKRHDRGVNAARERIAGWRATGAAGAMLLVRASMDGGDDAAGTDWLMTPEPRTDAGFTVGAAVGDPTPKSPFDQFLNVFSHTTNLTRFLAGAPIVLEAAVQGERSAALVGRIADAPFLGAFEDRVVPGWHERIDVVFERGRVTVALPPPFDRASAAIVKVTHSDGTVEDLSQPGWAFALQAASFVADASSGREPLAPGHDAVADVVLAEAFWQLREQRRA